MTEAVIWKAGVSAVQGLITIKTFVFYLIGIVHVRGDKQREGGQSLRTSDVIKLEQWKLFFAEAEDNVTWDKDKREYKRQSITAKE